MGRLAAAVKGGLREMGEIELHSVGSPWKSMEALNSDAFTSLGDGKKRVKKCAKESQSPPTPAEIRRDRSGHPRQRGMTHDQLFHHCKHKFHTKPNTVKSGH